MESAIFKYVKKDSDILFGLEDAQKYLLETLSIFQKFCEDNNIKYSLTYGSLIGAKREGTIIKWDDDIDLMMEAEEITKLWNCLSELEKYGLSFYHYSTHKHIYTNEVRIYKKGYYCVLENSGKEFLTPLCIDIFPINRIRTNDDEFICDKENKLLDKISKLKRILILKEAKYNSRNKFRSFLRSIKKLFYLPFSSNYFHKKIDARLEELYSGESNYVLFSPFANQTYHCYFAKDTLSGVSKIKFGNIEVFAIDKYDEFLTKVYGNWKKPHDDSDGKIYNSRFLIRL